MKITLWYVGGKDSISRIADRVGVSESTDAACRDKIMKAILKIKNRVVRWPTPQELQNEEQELHDEMVIRGLLQQLMGHILQ